MGRRPSARFVPGQNRLQRATRLGWASREKAATEMDRVRGCASVRIRQLADESWALVWPDGRVTGRFGTILPHEVSWS